MDEAPRTRDRRSVHAALLLLTIGSTTAVGGLHYLAFLADFRDTVPALGGPAFWLNGLWYSLTILAILGCHEMGHYLACRAYGVDASLPYFLPAPLPLTGTFGAFIRIRERIPTKAALFDIGIAGPAAGFVVAVPALVAGVSLSRVVTLPPDFSGFELGEPLLFRAVSWLVWGPVPDGASLNLHPMAFAAWFGLLATALNLFPIGQLDGGHIAYATLGHRATQLTIATVIVMLGLTALSTSWLVWTAMVLGTLLLFGVAHPPTLDADEPLDPTRRWLALGAVAMFVLSVTPVPIAPLDLLGTRP